MKYANLHLHSTYSDGGFTPLQLVLIGKSLGYYALALTDHETDGGVKQFFSAAKQEGLKSISGIECYGDGLGAKFIGFVAVGVRRTDPYRTYLLANGGRRSVSNFGRSRP